ncbi:hypothetical protein ANCDUO_25068 [Ancylostoma duodenale]|uniref:Uncharacterized protein n=1 Tax=Ancylostoma duodenale TaxID=51022 RepID=A0A0C2FE12_9BILA|nr:hypothetical protein ANCDUO_25068 [Ancylostoma duodenale]
MPVAAWGIAAKGVGQLTLFTETLKANDATVSNCGRRSKTFSIACQSPRSSITRFSVVTVVSRLLYGHLTS